MAKRDIEFLYEIGALRFVQRTWRQFFREDVANNSEHMFRVMWTALAISKAEKVKNEEKILKMALVHDIGESRCPDSNYLSKNYSTRDEDKALNDMLVSTEFEKEFVELFNEYHARKSIEAKIVKDADNLDVDFEIVEHAANGSTLIKNWKSKRALVYKELFTSTAKKMWKEIYNSDPNAWHVKGHEKYYKLKKNKNEKQI